MPRPKVKTYCRWWEEHADFNTGTYYTDCSGGDEPLGGDEHALAELVWKLGLAYCPFCGDEIDYCEPSEIIADAAAEAEYREGIRYGLYGY